VSKVSNKELQLKINQLAQHVVTFKDIAQNNEILLNRTIRMITQKLLQLRQKEIITKENIDELINEVNGINDKQQQQG
jgi:hypothetical protein